MTICLSVSRIQARLNAAVLRAVSEACEDLVPVNEVLQIQGDIAVLYCGTTVRTTFNDAFISDDISKVPSRRPGRPRKTSLRLKPITNSVNHPTCEQIYGKEVTAAHIGDPTVQFVFASEEVQEHSLSADNIEEGADVILIDFEEKLAVFNQHMFLCFMCGTGALGLCGVWSHFTRQHGGLLKCPDCDWKLGSRVEHLQVHCTDMHPTLNLFTYSSTKWCRCETCALPCGNNFLLALHALQKHAFACTMPGCCRPTTLCATRSDLQSHLRSAHNVAWLSFKGSSCKRTRVHVVFGKRPTPPKKHIVHVLVDENEQLICSYCNASRMLCADDSALKEHLRLVHNMTMNLTLKKKSVKDVLEANTAEDALKQRRFMCVHGCNQAFLTEKVFLRHMKQVHPMLQVISTCPIEQLRVGQAEERVDFVLDSCALGLVNREFHCYTCFKRVVGLRAVRQHVRQLVCTECAFYTESVDAFHCHVLDEHGSVSIFATGPNCCSECQFRTTSNFVMAMHVIQTHSAQGYACPLRACKSRKTVVYGCHRDVVEHIEADHPASAAKAKAALTKSTKTAPPPIVVVGQEGVMLLASSKASAAVSLTPIEDEYVRFVDEDGTEKRQRLHLKAGELHPQGQAGVLCPHCRFPPRRYENSERLAAHLSRAHRPNDGRRLRGVTVMVNYVDKDGNNRRTRIFPARGELDPNGQEGVQCAQCQFPQRRFADLARLKRHLYLSHRIGERGQIPRSRSRCRRLVDGYRRNTGIAGLLPVNSQHGITCTYCARRYTEQKYLDRHMKLSHREHLARNRIMSCVYCTKGFANKNLLTTHLNHMHKEHRSVPCEKADCDEKFFSRNAMFFHMQRKHPTFLPIQCTFCNATFRTQYGLDNHLVVAHNRTMLHLCLKCNAKFSAPDKLAFHQKRCGGRAASLMCYCCCKCCKNFSDVVQFRDHLLYCKGEGGLMCSICDLTFKCAMYYNNHMRRIHFANARYYCRVCNKGYEKFSAFRLHCLRLHNSEPDPQQHDHDARMTLVSSETTSKLVSTSSCIYDLPASKQLGARCVNRQQTHDYAAADDVDEAVCDQDEDSYQYIKRARRDTEHDRYYEAADPNLSEDNEDDHQVYAHSFNIKTSISPHYRRREHRRKVAPELRYLYQNREQIESRAGAAAAAAATRETNAALMYLT